MFKYLLFCAIFGFNLGYTPKAHAILFLAPLAAEGAADAAAYLFFEGAASGAVSDSAFLTASALAHAAIAAITFHNSPGTTPAPQTTPITINLDPNTPLITPQGWTPPVSPSTQPTPPQTTPSTKAYVLNGSTQSYPTPDGACHSLDGSVRPNGSTVTSSTFTPPSQCVLHLDDNGYKYNSNNTVYETTGDCPTGYTLSNSTCTLISPSSVPKPSDNKCTVIKNGATFTGDPQDPDCTNNTKTSKDITTTVESTKITAQAPNTNLTVIINPDGSTKLTTTTTNNNGTTTTTVLDIDSNNKLNGTKTYTEQGTGSLANPIGTSTGTASSLSSTPSLDISSLNKETTQQSIKTNTDIIKAQQCGYDDSHPCNQKINEDGVQAEITKSSTTLTDAKSKLSDAFNDLTNNIKNQKDGVGTGLDNPLSNEVPTYGCTNPVLDASDVKSGARAELHICEHASEIQPILSWACYMFTAVGIYQLWFRRTD